MKQKILSVALTSILLSSGVNAEIELSGFASVVGGITTSSDETLNGFDDALNFNQGSFLGLQATSNLGDKLGATVQIVADGKNDWEPSFRWAFLSYDATDNLRILAGRQRLPFYMYSDYLDVSYAYPWIVPPENSVYGSPTSVFDGLSAVYNTQFGDIDASFHGVYGSIDEDLTVAGFDTRTDANELVGLSSTFTYDWFVFRFAYFEQGDVTLPIVGLDGLAGQWQQAADASGLDFSEVIDSVQVKNDKVTFGAIGFQMNFDRLRIIGEYNEVVNKYVAFGDIEAYYLTGVYQFSDEINLHLTYEHNERTPNPRTGNVPVGINAGIDMLKGITESIYANGYEETSALSIGVRYDFHDSAAFKFEYKDFTDDLDSDNDAGLLRVAIVTVF